MIIKFLEQFGLYFFINTLLIISQLRWAQTFNYNDIEIRITMCFILSIILYLCTMKILSVKNINAANISFALSFSIIGIYLNSNLEILILLVVIAIIYYIKRYNVNSVFEYFWEHQNYKINFNSKECNVKIINNDKNKLSIFKLKYLLSELFNCIIYCKGNKLSKLTIESEEIESMNSIITNIFIYFNIEVEIVNDLKITH